MELKTNVLYYGDNLEMLGKTLRFAQGDRGRRLCAGWPVWAERVIL